MWGCPVESRSARLVGVYGSLALYMFVRWLVLLSALSHAHDLGLPTAAALGLLAVAGYEWLARAVMGRLVK